MDANRVLTGPGEEWITKYRAAIDAVPVRQSRWARFRAALQKARGILTNLRFREGALPSEVVARESAPASAAAHSQANGSD